MRDGTGGVLSGVTVNATSASLQGARAAATDGQGRFRLAALPPGAYVVHAELAGFRSLQKPATVPLDASVTVDFVLEPAVSEAVSVGAEAPRIDATSTTGGTNYSAGVVARLPVDRNYADIVRSNPGVGTDRGDTQGRSLALTIYGATSAENQWVIDGINTTSVIKGVQGKAINNEFVQEVEVKTGGYQAEYGGALGGIVNVVTKSGGNEFHGDAFVYYDSAGTTAQQVFIDGVDSPISQMRVAEAVRLDFGADLGGFLVKDSLWFFGAYNRVELNSQVSRFENGGDVTTADRFPLDATDNLYSFKLTWNATPSTNAVATVFADPSTSEGAAGANPYMGPATVTPPLSLDSSTWYSSRDIGGTDFGARVTQLLSSQALVTLQGALHRDKYSLGAADAIRYEDWTCDPRGPQGSRKAPCALPDEPWSVTGGYGGISGRDDHNSSTREQYSGAVTFYEGSHQVQAGGGYQDGRTQGLGFFSGGQYVQIRNDYGTPFYAHTFVAVSVEDPTLVPGYRPQAWVQDYGAYLQDSWRAAAGLTLNLGLRWDGENTKDFAGESVLRFSDGWQPRLGITWDPWKDGRTKVSAFAGRFSYAQPTILAIAEFSGVTILEADNRDRVSVVPDPSLRPNGEYQLVNGGGPIGDHVDSGLGAMYQDELTLGIEREIDPSLTLGLKATYRSLGRGLESRCDFLPADGYTNCAIINPGSSGPYARGDAPVSNGYDDPYREENPSGPASPAAKRIYRGIEVLLRKSVGQNLWLQASYVYSSLRGNFDGAVNQSSYGGNSVSNNADFDYPQMWHDAYGRLALDRTNRFRLDGYWVTPWGLTLGVQGFAESGEPLNRTGYFNGNYGSVIYLVPRGSAGSLPTLWEASLSLGYPIVFGPVTVSLQAYLYNVFNNQTPTLRDQAWTISQVDGYPDTIFDPGVQKNNDDYGKNSSRYAPRSFRAAVRVSF